MLKSYIKILALAGAYLDVILNGNPVVEVSEKIDGSQFVFGKDEDGNLHFRSKGAIIDGAAPPDMFRPAVLHVHQVAHRISPNTVFYCETLQKPRHNSLTYDRIPRNHIAIYGVTDYHRTEAEDDPKELEAWADVLEVDTVPILYRGSLRDLDHIKEFMQGDSALGGGIREGVVIKRYNYPWEFNGQTAPFAAFKYVSEKFKEVHASNPDWKPQKEGRLELLERYRSEARWLKAVQFLKEKGELVGAPKDIGSLMPRILEDLVEEEKENFKEELYKIYQKEWKATAVRGFAQWYKDYLVEGDSSGNRAESDVR